METAVLMGVAAAGGAAMGVLWCRHRLLAAFRTDPIRTVKRLCHEAYPPDELFD